MVKRKPLVYLGDAPNVIRLTEVTPGDTLDGVVNHDDLVEGSVVVKTIAGDVSSLIVHEGTVIGRLVGGDVVALTVAELKEMLDVPESLTDLGGTTEPGGLVPVTPAGSTLLYDGTAWQPTAFNFNALLDVSATNPDVGDTVSFGVSGWAANRPKNVVFLGDERLASFQALPSYLYPIDTRAQVVSVLPPSNPVAGDKFSVSDSRNNASNNNIIVRFSQLGQNLFGVATDAVLTSDKIYVTYTYINVGLGWIGQINAADVGTGGVTPAGNGLEYTHTQNVAASTWTIDHNLDAYPSITVVDSSGDKVHADIRYNSNTRISVFHSTPLEGIVYLS